MKTRLLMIIGIVGFASLVVPNVFGICSSSPCENSPMKPESNYRFIDFSYVYYSGEPIQFTLEKTLNDDCNSYTVKIIDQDGNFVWNGGAYVLCDPTDDSNSISSQIKIGHSENHPIIINKLGKYYLEIEFDNAFIKQEFVIRQNTSVNILKVNDLFSGFFTDADMRLSGHVFEVGNQIKLQQRIDNNSYNSEQKGTLNFYFYPSLSQESSEFHKSFDFDINPHTYEIFVVEHAVGKPGFFVIETDPIMEEPYQLGGYSYLFSVVDEYSKGYEKNNECSENFRSVIKPDYSTVVYVSDDTFFKLTQQRGWRNS